ncbi:MAG: GlsB/YeaQ/YmgE family stress response membrane protein [Anaerolineae bacterium]|nr:GlsB/YeaQ/YmgE family stress response membrane protein [Anaerolineae bacterium]
MEGQSLILFLLIGLVAGWLAGHIMKGGGFGLLGDLIVGVVGSFLGGWIFGLFGLSANGLIGSLVTALVGAIVLLYLLHLIKRA